MKRALEQVHSRFDIPRASGSAQRIATLEVEIVSIGVLGWMHARLCQFLARRPQVQRSYERGINLVFDSEQVLCEAGEFLRPDSPVTSDILKIECDAKFIGGAHYRSLQDQVRSDFSRDFRNRLFFRRSLFHCGGRCHMHSLKLKHLCGERIHESVRNITQRFFVAQNFQWQHGNVLTLTQFGNSYGCFRGLNRRTEHQMSGDWNREK